jgi:hypothetical protein
MRNGDALILDRGCGKWGFVWLRNLTFHRSGSTLAISIGTGNAGLINLYTSRTTLYTQEQILGLNARAHQGSN